MCGGGELAHVQADLGDDHLGGLAADAGDLVQATDRRQRPAGRCPRRCGSPCPAGGWAAGMAPISSSMRLVSLSIWRASASIWSSSIRASSAWWSLKRPVSASHQGGALAAHPASGQLGEHLGVALPGDQRLDHGPTGDAHDVGRHGGELDQGVLEQLLHPLLVPGAFLGQVGPQAGVVAQLADLGGWDERGAQHAPLVELGQPHRVQLVGLGAARDLLDVAGVDQPHRQPRGLQQVDERPPVVRGGLHHHPFDALAGS